MGYAIEDRLGGSCFEIIHPDDAERVRFIYRKGAKGQVKTDKAEYRMRHADGHYLWLESTGKALRDDGDRFAGFVICLRDITERKQAEISLHRSQEHFRALFESAPVGIVITRSGKILSANHAFRNMLDLKDPAELADQPLTEYMAPNYRQEILERLSNLERDANAPRLLEALGLKKDGSTFSVYIELSRLDLLNAAPAVVAFISDITERK
jgi:PAS domain S-box-containing protein